MARSVVTEDRAKKEASYIMLHVGLDLSRKRVDVCLISDQGSLVDELAAPFDEDGLCRLPERVGAKHTGRVRAVVESMNGARFVHDTLEAHGWDVQDRRHEIDETSSANTRASILSVLHANGASPLTRCASATEVQAKARQLALTTYLRVGQPGDTEQIRDRARLAERDQRRVDAVLQARAVAHPGASCSSACRSRRRGAKTSRRA